MEMNHPERHQRQIKNYLPWRETPDSLESEQAEWQIFLIDEYGLELGEDVYLSPDAVLDLPDGRIGDETIVASGAIVRGDVEIGAHCSVNPYVNVAGDVTIGDDVRIGSTASIWGHNHVHEDPDTPIRQQGLRKEGIEIGDDVWIGAGAVVLDGTTIGSHCVVGAGAVVTDDVPPYSLVAGNPAEVIRDRRDGRSAIADADGDADLGDRLERFGDTVAGQVRPLLEHYRCDEGEGEYFLDRPDADRTVRAWCDAVEIAGMFDTLPPGWERDELVAKLQGLQDPETGLIPDPEHPPDPDADPTRLPDTWHPYNVLSVGYALEVLDAMFEHRLSAVDDLTPEALYDHLDGLPWEDSAWSCGAWIDHYATGLYFNRRYFDGQRSPASVFGWLETNVSPENGLWGEPTASESWKQPVNGFYRLTRGTYAQFGLDVPYPEVTIDMVLRHSRNPQFFREDALNACNVLDVIHPLWLCGQQTDYRRADATQWARTQIDRVLDHWHEERGFAFELTGDTPSLQGTEMWLSILYLLATTCGLGDRLGYEPKGVHRTEVALDIHN